MPEGASTAKKLFVIDTSSLIHAGSDCANPALMPFGHHDVVIPMMDIEELDNNKRDSEIGHIVRGLAHTLDEAFSSPESMLEGVPTYGGGTLRIVGVNSGDFKLPKEFASENGDNFILSVAGNLHTAEQAKPFKERRQVVLITKDVALRLKARASGLEAEDLQVGKVARLETLGPRIHEVEVPSELIDELYQQGSIPVDDLNLPSDLPVNSCCRLSDSDGGKQSALGLFVQGNRIVVVKKEGNKGKKIMPRNAEQIFAYNLAMRPEVLTTIMVGIAGTGKTLMALKAGVDLLEDTNSPIQRIICFRPMVDIGKSLGFLPGDAKEKFALWARPIYGNLHLLLGQSFKGTNEEESYKSTEHNKGNGKQDKPAEHKDKLSVLLETGIISIEPITFVRGATFPNTFIIVDEAQNLTPEQIKAILTRAGEGSKIILTGDLTQIDDPHLDAASCGLAKVLERTMGHHRFAGIELIKGERSELATLFAKLLHDL